MITPLRLTAVFEEATHGGFNAYFEEMPEISSKGATLDEAKANLAAAYQAEIKANAPVDVTNRKKSLQQALDVIKASIKK
jgi:predicted RNase H-like HicB family nuclease